MPMVETIHSPFRSRERIMGYGRESGGKSSGLLSIARHCPNDMFYIIDNDNAYDRLLETDFKDVWANGNVKFAGEDFGKRPLSDWDNAKACIAWVLENMGRDDWLSIDFLNKFWSQVQSSFIQKIFGKEMDDYFLQVRLQKERAEKDSKALGAFDGWKDWPVINSMYHSKVSEPLLNCHGHLYVVSESTKINMPDNQGKGGDDKATRELYGSVGVRPDGQKRSGHIMQTVIFFSKTTRTNEFKLTTIKDRGRVMWNDEPFGDFAMDYLVGTAGWEVRKQYVAG